MRDTAYNIDPASISAEEWQARCDLAALYRLVAHFRWTDHIDTHISARVPGEPGHYLINRYGVMFHEMRASDLVKVDHAGDVIDPRFGPDSVNRAGFNIHSAVHAARPDVACVIHTHTAAGIAVSAQEEGLLPISQHALKYHNRLGYHDYEGIALSFDEQQRLVRDLGDHLGMILRNHGLLTVGASVKQAFLRMYYLEKACDIQIAAQAGGELVIPPDAVCRRTERQFNEPHQPQAEGELSDPDGIDLAWEALLRMLDRIQPDYRN